MAKTGKPPRFKVLSVPRAIAAQKIAKQGRFRGSPAERGYDEKWNRLSIAFRKQNPFCRWCLQINFDGLAQLVDHIIPVTDRPDLIHSWKNLQSLCRHHHGKKFSMEVYARDNGMLEMLPKWCEEITNRPPQFR